MRIVINALAYKPNSTGIGLMILELFGRYAQRTGRACDVLLCADAPDFPVGANTRLIRIPVRYGQGLKRMAYQLFQMGPKNCKDALLLTTDAKTPFFLPKSCKLLTHVSDLGLYHIPQAYQASRVLLWRLQYRYILRRAKRFLTVSEFTRRDMVNLFGLKSEQIDIVPSACSPLMKRVEDERTLEQVRAAYALPERFVLFVGSANPRKNLRRTIEAYDRFREQSELSHVLVIAGEQGWKFSREKTLEGIRHREDVRFIGFVPDEHMSALYSAADAFLFPTLYEGFGVPVLEAQRCGVPVVASQSGSLPEIAGDAAVLVDPDDPQSICDGLRSVLEDEALARELVRKGYENEKRFSWDESAKRLEEIIEREFMS